MSIKIPPASYFKITEGIGKRETEVLQLTV
jgi:hypothetical protein